MLSLADSTEKNKPNNFYKKVLKDLILNNQLYLKTEDFNLEKYIAAFSFYMHESNEAYKYNTPYLIHQHKNFGVFLKSASQKYELLLSIIEAMRSSIVIQQFIKEKSNKIDDIKIELNNFLVADLDGNISFQETFSFSGANRNVQDDVLTVQYNGHVRSCKITAKINTLDANKYDPIVEMTERVLEIHEKLEV